METKNTVAKTQGVKAQEIKQRSVSKFTTVKSFAKTIERLEECNLVTEEESKQMREALAKVTQRLFEEIN